MQQWFPVGPEICCSESILVQCWVLLLSQGRSGVSPALPGTSSHCSVTKGSSGLSLTRNQAQPAVALLGTRWWQESAQAILQRSRRRGRGLGITPGTAEPSPHPGTPQAASPEPRENSHPAPHLCNKPAVNTTIYSYCSSQRFLSDHLSKKFKLPSSSSPFHWMSLVTVQQKGKKILHVCALPAQDHCHCTVPVKGTSSLRSKLAAGQTLQN